MNPTSIMNLFKKHERRVIDVEKTKSCQLVFTCTSGTGPSDSKAPKELATKLCDEELAKYGIDLIKDCQFKTFLRTFSNSEFIFRL